MKNLIKFLAESRGQDVLSRRWNRPYNSENDPLVLQKQSRQELAKGLKAKKTMEELVSIEKSLVKENDLDGVVSYISVENNAGAYKFPETFGLLSIDYEVTDVDDGFDYSEIRHITVYDRTEYEDLLPCEEIDYEKDLNSLTFSDLLGSMCAIVNYRPKSEDLYRAYSIIFKDGNDEYLEGPLPECKFLPQSLADVCFVIHFESPSNQYSAEATKIESFKKAVEGMSKGKCKRMKDSNGEILVVDGSCLQRNKNLFSTAIKSASVNPI